MYQSPGVDAAAGRADEGRVQTAAIRTLAGMAPTGANLLRIRYGAAVQFAERGGSRIHEEGCSDAETEGCKELCGVVCRLALTAVLTVVVALAAASSATAATSPPVWGPSVAYQSSSSGTETLFLSISCVSVGNCVAVGASESITTSNSTPIVAAESSGTWGPAAAVTQLPAGATTSSNNIAALASVSCTSATTCVAVGQYENAAGGTDPMEVPIDVSGVAATVGAATAVALPSAATSASSANQRSLLDSVSCDSARNCAAVGFYVDGSGNIVPMTAMPSGATWSATEVTALPAAAASEIELTAISCPSSGACEAVGNYANGSGDLEPWAVAVTGGSAGQGRTVGLPANSEATSDPGFNLLNVVNAGLVAVSCPSPGVCTAAGEYSTASAESGVAVPITSGEPGTPVELGASGNPSAIIAIWCSDATDCTVAGSTLGPGSIEGITGSEAGGIWSPLTQLTLGEGNIEAEISGMTCASASRCVASGLEVNSVSAAETLSSFFANSEPALSVDTTSLPAAHVGAPYSATLEATGGSEKNTWSIAPGSLPAGLSLNASTGVISGTPTASGQSGFIVNATDAGPPIQSASGGLSITVSPVSEMSTAQSTVGIAFLRTSGAKATVVLSCSGAPCAGALKITAVERLNGKKPTAVVASKEPRAKRRTKKITLTSGRYSLAAGHTRVLTLKLSKNAGALLKRLHKLAGDLNVTPTGANHPAFVKKTTFTAKSNKSSKSKKHKH